MQRLRRRGRTGEEKTWEHLLSTIFGHSPADPLNQFFSVDLDPLCVSRSLRPVHTSILRLSCATRDVYVTTFAGSSNDPRVSSYRGFANRHKNQTRTIGCDNSFS